MSNSSGSIRTALSDEARALVLVEKVRLDNERAALQRKKTALTASEQRRLEKLNAELGEDVVFINEQAAVKNAQLAWLRDALATSRARWKVVSGTTRLTPLQQERGATGANGRC